MGLLMRKPTIVHDSFELVFIVDPRIRLRDVKLPRFLPGKVDDLGSTFSGRWCTRAIVIPLLDTLDDMHGKPRYVIKERD